MYENTKNVNSFVWRCLSSCPGPQSVGPKNVWKKKGLSLGPWSSASRAEGLKRSPRVLNRVGPLIAPSAGPTGTWEAHLVRGQKGHAMGSSAGLTVRVTLGSALIHDASIARVCLPSPWVQPWHAHTHFFAQPFLH